MECLYVVESESAYREKNILVFYRTAVQHIKISSDFTRLFIIGQKSWYGNCWYDPTPWRISYIIEDMQTILCFFPKAPEFLRFCQKKDDKNFV